MLGGCTYLGCTAAPPSVEASFSVLSCVHCGWPSSLVLPLNRHHLPQAPARGGVVLLPAPHLPAAAAAADQRLHQVLEQD
jgi:hypothetical protein